jgi:hypothetical protein
LEQTGSPSRYAFVDGERLVWWLSGSGYGDRPASVTIGPGVQRQLSLAILGGSRGIYEALGGQWSDLADRDRSFHARQAGVWAVHPLAPDAEWWIKPNDAYCCTLTITARDVDAIVNTVYFRIVDEVHHESSDSAEAGKVEITQKVRLTPEISDALPPTWLEQPTA